MNYKPVLFAVLRVVLYAIPVFFAAQIVLWDASVAEGAVKFGENSMTEWSQELFLLLTSIAFLIGGFVDKSKRGISYLMSGGAMMAFIREFDWLFDKIYHGAWLPFAMVVLLLTLWGVFKNRTQIWNNLEEFFNKPAFGTLIAGFLTVFVFSRLFGRKVVWRAVFEVDKLEPAQRWVKNACEEGVELFGYALLFIAGIEFLVYVFKERKDS